MLQRHLIALSPTSRPRGARVAFSPPDPLHGASLEVPQTGAILDPHGDESMQAAEHLAAANTLEHMYRQLRAERHARHAERLFSRDYPAATAGQQPRLPTVSIALSRDESTVLPRLTQTMLVDWLAAITPRANITELEQHAHTLMHAAATATSGQPEGRERVFATALLTKLLQDGLEARHGTQLTTQERIVYLTLRAFGAGLAHYRACETCSTVFTGKNAHQCPSCNSSPPRYRIHEWHTTPVHIAERLRLMTRITHNEQRKQSQPAPVLRCDREALQVIYTTTCQACPSTFRTRNAKTRYCPECATSTRRSQRSRANEHK